MQIVKKMVYLIYRTFSAVERVLRKKYIHIRQRSRAV